jgi:hypothetical protein
VRAGKGGKGASTFEKEVNDTCKERERESTFWAFGDCLVERVGGQDNREAAPQKAKKAKFKKIRKSFSRC